MRSGPRSLRAHRHPLLLTLGLAWGPLVFGATSTIYSCVDSQGRRLSADRPIAECLDRSQRLHNGDGSVRAVAPPWLSPDEQARQDRQRQRLELDEAARAVAARRDRKLLALYPTAAAHEAARARALAPVLRQIEEARSRLTALEAESASVAEGLARPAPPRTQEDLRARLATIDGATAAQRELLRDRSDERDRLARRLDEELATLRLLWAGEPPGTTRLPGRAEAAASAP